MLDEEWEGSLEEIIRSLLERNTLESIKPALVPLLKLLGEGLISVVGSACHIKKNSGG